MSAAKRKAPDSAANAEKKAKASTITGFFSTASSSQSKAPFDVKKWADTLSPEKRDLLKLEIDTMDPTWLAVLKDAIVDPSFLSLKKFLKGEFLANRVYPPAEDVYSWSRYTPFDKVKVVILGQDPYHGPKQAHGLSFSVKPPTKAPPSLRNIFGGLENDFPSFKAPANGLGSLVPWAERGVLMLNTCLTVQPSNANSHANKGWEQFTQKVIDVVSQKRMRGVVFMAWGKPAQGRVSKVNKTTHLILQSCHPSPLAAFKGPVFFKDGHHFRQCNAWLEEKYGSDGPIDWNSVNPSSPSLFAPQTEASTSKAAVPAKVEKSKDAQDEEAVKPKTGPPQLRAQIRAKKAEEERKKAEAQKPTEDEEYGVDDVDWAEAELKSDQIEEEYIKAKGKGKKVSE